MKISDVCRRTGLTKRTVRFYLECGLVSPKVEYRNERSYKEYSEEDIQRLTTIAGLRRARFSISQIKFMFDSPEAIPEVYSGYMGELRELARTVAQLLKTASDIKIADINSADELCRALLPATQKMPLPRKDVQPRFARFDGPEFTESKETAEFHRRQYRNDVEPTVIAGSSAGYNSASGLSSGDLNMANYALMKSGVLPYSKRSQKIIITVTAVVAGLLAIAGVLGAFFHLFD